MKVVVAPDSFKESMAAAEAAADAHDLGAPPPRPVLEGRAPR